MAHHTPIPKDTSNGCESSPDRASFCPIVALLCIIAFAASPSARSQQLVANGVSVAASNQAFSTSLGGNANSALYSLNGGSISASNITLSTTGGVRARHHRTLPSDYASTPLPSRLPAAAAMGSRVLERAPPFSRAMLRSRFRASAVSVFGPITRPRSSWMADASPPRELMQAVCGSGWFLEVLEEARLSYPTPSSKQPETEASAFASRNDHSCVIAST